jgi:hypothetical protein
MSIAQTAGISVGAVEPAPIRGRSDWKALARLAASGAGQASRDRQGELQNARRDATALPGFEPLRRE